MVEFSLPRGLRDIPPEESASAEAVRAAFIDNCRLFDYKLMEPSSLELIETLEAKSGPSIRNEIYFFKDKSGRDLGLRFDLTVGITRYVTARRDLTPPVRLGSYSSMWRYEEPQYGRYRWFYQWDVELFGPSNAEADAEIIEFSYSLFKKLGTRPKISIGSRKIIELFIRNKLGILDEKRILNALRGVDKLAKKSLDEIALEYSDSVSKEQFQAIAAFAKLKGDANSFSNTLKEYGIEDNSLVEILDSLKSRGVQNAEPDLRIVRGIDYYTDMVFEAFDIDNLRLGSLCGGGRYDSLPAVYGRPDIGATGVAGGVERAVLAYKISRDRGKKFFVAPVGKDLDIIRAAASIAATLRTGGIAAQSEISEKSLRKILEAQAEAGTTGVIIVGEKEMAAGNVKIKWMSTGEEQVVKKSDLVTALANRL
ncbi:MAG: histidine--tRNA ligase [archaeon]|nr:histidine--tRNA ligase [archaeon]